MGMTLSRGAYWRVILGKFHPNFPINCSNTSVPGESSEEFILNLAPSWSRYGAWGPGTGTTLIARLEILTHYMMQSNYRVPANRSAEQRLGQEAK